MDGHVDLFGLFTPQIIDPYPVEVRQPFSTKQTILP